MSSLNKFNDLNSPLIVNMGTQNIKYTQPILSPYKLSKKIINKIESEEPTTEKPIEEEEMINANSIFDFQGLMKIKPTLNFLENSSFKLLDFNLYISDEIYNKY